MLIEDLALSFSQRLYFWALHTPCSFLSLSHLDVLLHLPSANLLLSNLYKNLTPLPEPCWQTTCLPGDLDFALYPSAISTSFTILFHKTQILDQWESCLDLVFVISHGYVLTLHDWNSPILSSDLGEGITEAKTNAPSNIYFPVFASSSFLHSMCIKWAPTTCQSLYWALKVLSKKSVSVFHRIVSCQR